MKSFFASVSSSEAWKNGELVNKNVLVNDNGKVKLYEFEPPQPKKQTSKRGKSKKSKRGGRRTRKKYQKGGSLFGLLARNGRQGKGERNDVAHEECLQRIGKGNYSWPENTPDVLRNAKGSDICGNKESEMHLNSSVAPAANFRTIPISREFRKALLEARSGKN